MNCRPRRVGTAPTPVGSPPRPADKQQLSKSCKLPLLPRQSIKEPSTSEKLSRYQKMLPNYPFAAKTASSTARTSSSRAATNNETATVLREVFILNACSASVTLTVFCLKFFEAIMPGHPNQKVENINAVGD